MILVMVKCCVLFEVRTETLNTIQTSFGFRGLNDGEGSFHVLIKVLSWHLTGGIEGKCKTSVYGHGAKV
jgi:hypothetical protein